MLIAVIGFLGHRFTLQMEESNLYPRPYYNYVSAYAAKYEVPESVVYAVMKTESNFQSEAKSNAGACGLMQLMPGTFTWIEGKLGENLADNRIFDPETNIRYGIYYLSWLHSDFEKWETVYAAYNAGPTCVSTWLEDSNSEEDALSDIPYEETANYVDKVGATQVKYQNIYGN